MKRALKILVASLILGFVLIQIYFAMPSREQGRLDGFKLGKAVEAYRNELQRTGAPVPASVSVQELLDRKLLNSEDVSAFGGMAVTVNLRVEAGRPETVLARARLKNGDEIVVLADGSVQERLN